MNPRNTYPTVPLWVPLLAILALFSGCADDPEAPVVEPFLTIEGGAIPEVVFEGEAIEVHAWGAVDRNGGAFQSLEIEVLSHPGREPGQIEVRAVAGGTSPSGAVDFEGRVSLPPLRPGEYLVHLVGRGITRTLAVLPQAGWVRYRSYHDPMRPDEGLLIESDGWAVAYRHGTGRSERTQLSRERMGEIGTWFRATEFGNLESEYLSGDRNRMRIVEVSLTSAAGIHRVVAEEDLMPAGLQRVEAQLQRLVDELIDDRPQPARVGGQIRVDPIEADPGVARRIQMTLKNEGERPVTLFFSNGQQYDFRLLRTGDVRDPNGESGGDDPDHDGTGTDERMLVWNWAHGLSFPEVATQLELEAGGVHRFEAEWDGLDNRGHRVGAGVYVLEGVIPSRSDFRVRVEPTRLVVKGQVPDRMPLVGTLTIVPATAPRGTPREITLSITNLNRTELVREFIDTQRYDFAIHGRPSDRPTDPNGRALVWQWSDGRGFGDMPGRVAWAPGQTHTYVETWDGNERDGTTAGVGYYLLRSWMTSRPGVNVHPVPVVVSE